MEPETEVKKKEYTQEEKEALLATAGTVDQTEVIDFYATRETKDKLRIPYIERYNGNICAKNQNFDEAIAHYNKALLAMKMLFTGH